MALWMQSSGTLYLPPSRPTARVLRTDEYVRPTSIFFHAQTDRLLLVGHPHFDVYDGDNNVTVPKVSASQFRVMKLMLPDPNKFAAIDPNIYNPDKERLVWKLQGLEIDRGSPLGIGATGHPLFNKYIDTENPAQYPEAQANDKDYRVNMSWDPKQVQMFLVGSSPPVGKYWDTDECADLAKDKCPPITLKHSIIQDGDMCDIGFGNINYAALQQDKSSAPLELVATVAKWPDFERMTKDLYGDMMFFYGKKEQLYARHFFAPAGAAGDAVPENTKYYVQPSVDKTEIGPYNYQVIPSGSLCSTESQIFNRPYWLQRSQGANNGIIWGNNLFLTIVDNTRATNFIINRYTGTDEFGANYRYKQNEFKSYLRHAEEFEVEIILELCVVALEPDVLAHLNVMNPRILEGWQLAFIPPPPEGIVDAYRYIKSIANTCPNADPNAKVNESDDPYKDYVFWNVDLRERLTSDLSQTSLGKRFLYQTNLLGTRVRRNFVNSAATTTVTKRKAVKRKRGSR